MGRLCHSVLDSFANSLSGALMEDNKSFKKKKKMTAKARHDMK